MSARPIIARFLVAPASDDRATFLWAVVHALAYLNEAWLIEQIRAGKRPPARLLLAEPPWCATPPRYVPHHGARARARERDYYDGPTAMHRGEATCIEIAAYDVAAISALQHLPAAPHVVGRWPDLHFMVQANGRIIDTSTRDGALASLARPEAPCRSLYS